MIMIMIVIMIMMMMMIMSYPEELEEMSLCSLSRDGHLQHFQAT